MDFASSGPFDSLSMSSEFSILSDSQENKSLFLSESLHFSPHALINNNLEFWDNWNAGFSNSFILQQWEAFNTEVTWRYTLAQWQIVAKVLELKQSGIHIVEKFAMWTSIIAFKWHSTVYKSWKQHWLISSLPRYKTNIVTVRQQHTKRIVWQRREGEEGHLSLSQCERDRGTTQDVSYAHTGYLCERRYRSGMTGQSRKRPN